MSKHNKLTHNASIKRLTLWAKSLNPLLKRIPNAKHKPKDETKAKAWESDWAKKVDKSVIRYFAERPEFTDNRVASKIVDSPADDKIKDSVKY